MAFFLSNIQKETDLQKQDENARWQMRIVIKRFPSHKS
jgi:hypothetical protein